MILVSASVHLSVYDITICEVMHPFIVSFWFSEEKRLRDIDSEVAPSDLADDPDMLTSDLIDDILEKELGRGYPQVKRPDTSRLVDKHNYTVND